jgi:hypothetical protein
VRSSDDMSPPAPRRGDPPGARVVLASALTLGAGLAIAWLDTRPGWDDTGITAGALAIAAGLGALAGVPAWLAAALVAGPAVVAELSGGAGVLLAVPIALAGACAGALARRLDSRARRRKE